MGRPHASPRAILGIDFSGAADAGHRVWITQARDAGGRLRIDACDSAVGLLGCAPQPGACHAALVDFLAGRGACVVGCDFPFSLPAATIGERTWGRFLVAFPRHYPAAALFHDVTHRRWGETRRACERAARTPFAPNNLRLYRQTYSGLRAVLLPLVRRGAVRVVPMQAPRPGVPWLLECCPASALKRLGQYRPYKGAGPAPARRRAAMLRHLARYGGLAPLAPPLRRRIVAQSGGDALDSLLAAWIAWQALRKPGGLMPYASGWPAIEGYVYF
jgi:hypothetical protein